MGVWEYENMLSQLHVTTFIKPAYRIRSLINPDFLFFSISFLAP